MQCANHVWMSFGGAVAALGMLSGGLAVTGAAAEVAAPQADVVAGAWQHHKVTFDYTGFTSLYSCDGLEGHVRQILLHLGARNDVKVVATGCPGPVGGPSRHAWVDVDFYSLAAADAGGSDTVKAHWTPLDVTPRRPGFMGDGDCELVQGMKDLITKNFSLRDIQYSTDCFPHELWPAGFEIKGQALRAVNG